LACCLGRGHGNDSHAGVGMKKLITIALAAAMLLLAGCGGESSGGYTHNVLGVEGNIERIVLTSSVLPGELPRTFLLPGTINTMVEGINSFYLTPLAEDECSENFRSFFVIEFRFDNETTLVLVIDFQLRFNPVDSTTTSNPVIGIQQQDQEIRWYHFDGDFDIIYFITNNISDLSQTTYQNASRRLITGLTRTQ